MHPKFLQLLNVHTKVRYKMLAPLGWLSSWNSDWNFSPEVSHLTNPLLTYALRRFPNVWSSLFTTKWAAFGTFVSFVMVILKIKYLVGFFSNCLGAVLISRSYRGFAQQPCCMTGTMKMFCIRKNFFFHRKKNILFLPCNMAAVQNLYCLFIFLSMVLFNEHRVSL